MSAEGPRGCSSAPLHHPHSRHQIHVGTRVTPARMGQAKATSRSAPTAPAPLTAAHPPARARESRGVRGTPEAALPSGSPPRGKPGWRSPGRAPPGGAALPAGAGGKLAGFLGSPSFLWQREEGTGGLSSPGKPLLCLPCPIPLASPLWTMTDRAKPRVVPLKAHSISWYRDCRVRSQTHCSRKIKGGVEIA